jgi:uncharacterized protein YbjT (DUF2867 family)
MGRTAIVIGATGLVGSHLLDQLLADDRFSEVKIFGRRKSGHQHPKLKEFIIDFNAPLEWNHLVQGDVLFSALGTTLKTAGSKKAQYLIDHNYQYHFALAASKNHVPVYVLVSAAMANENSRIFYSRMKGELERDVKKLPFNSIHILQPGILDGERKEKRIGENLGMTIIKFLNSIGIAKKQKPVHAGIVAKAMINLSFKDDIPLGSYSLLEVFEQAGEV